MQLPNVNAPRAPLTGIVWDIVLDASIPVVLYKLPSVRFSHRLITFVWGCVLVAELSLQSS
jgi:hypothetical protein